MKIKIPSLNEIDRVLCQKSLVEFSKQAWQILEPKQKYIHNWHIDAICEHLEAASRGEILKLLINVPPRHMKSLLVSVFWQAWEWTWNPSSKWLQSSYAHNLSIRDAVKCRRLIQSQWYQSFFNDSFKLTSDQNEKTRFENDKTGNRIATSVGGSGTGEGGDRVLCLPYEQKIFTKNGEIEIGNIVEDKINIEVLSYNHNLQTFEFKEILEYEKNNQYERIVEILVDDKIIHCTESHPVYVYGKGYIKAIDVKSVKVIDRKVDNVYNIRIKDNKNYFCNGVLLHNCDDPHKVSEAESDTKRKAVIDWWNEEMSTRGNDPKKSAYVIVMQRIHEADLSAEVLSQGDYVHLCLPAEFEPIKKCFTMLGWEDPRKEEGELLFPERFDSVYIKNNKNTLGSRAYAGQFQQRPSPAKGDIFLRSWWKFYNSLPEHFDSIIQSWDMTFRKSANSNSYVISQVWGKIGANKYLIDQLREKLSFTETLDAMRSMKAKHPLSNMILVERAANGDAIIDTLSTEIEGIIAYEPRGKGSKEERAIAQAPQVEAGNVWLPSPAICPWINDFVERATIFPNGDFKDEIDAMSQALDKMKNVDIPVIAPVSLTKKSLWK